MRTQQRILRFLAITSLLALLMSSCAGSSTATAGQILLVPASEAAQLLDDPVRMPTLLDVRTPQEFVEARIPQTFRNVDFYESDFKEQLDKLQKDTPYVVYCRSGNRSAEAVKIMRELGFSQVWEVDGGILSWIEAGLPVETGPPL